MRRAPEILRSQTLKIFSVFIHSQVNPDALKSLPFRRFFCPLFLEYFLTHDRASRVVIGSSRVASKELLRVVRKAEKDLSEGTYGKVEEVSRPQQWPRPPFLRPPFAPARPLPLRRTCLVLHIQGPW